MRFNLESHYSLNYYNNLNFTPSSYFYNEIELFLAHFSPYYEVMETV